MSLRMFVGKPGGGKSYGALLDIIEELVRGDRVVVTNLSILPGELNALLAVRHPEWAGDIHQRLVLLTAEETKRFWLVRGPGPDGRLADVSREDEKAGRFPDFASKAGPGCLYVIDEAHVPFDARGWAESGQSLTYYNSQHRKLNDELIFVTQFIELVDKRIRGFAQDYRFFRNNGVERVFTFFRLPAYFTCKVYQRPPSGMTDAPSETHRYRLDVAIAACYDTSAGVGISGRRRPEVKKKGGLAVGWLSLPVFGLLAALYYVPELLSKGLTRATTLDRSEVPGSASVAAVSPVSAPVVVAPSSVSSAVVSAPDLTVSGVVRLGGRINVILSDGRVLTERDAELQRVERNSVTIDGRKVFFGRPVVSPRVVQAGLVLADESATRSARAVSESEIREKLREGVSAAVGSVGPGVPSSAYDSQKSERAVPGRGSGASRDLIFRESPRVLSPPAHVRPALAPRAKG